MFVENATLTFTFISDITTGFDPVTDAPVFAETTQQVKASLEETFKPKNTILPGVDETALYVEGRLVNPKYLTNAMRSQNIVTIVFNRGKNITVTGKLYLIPTLRSRFNLDKRFGDFIAGYLQVTKG